MAGNYKINITPRGGLIAPPGYSIAAVDWSGQEAMIGAYYSGDKHMLDIFRQPTHLESGEKNPQADIHCINAMNCTHPHLFKGVPPEKQVKVAKDPTLIREKGCARDWAKPLQYGIQYLESAQSMSERYHIPKTRAEEWIGNHSKLFPKYHDWVGRQQKLAEERGWARTPDGFMRLVKEDNAKQAGSSPGRSGVNMLIQAAGSSMAKRALSRIFRELNIEVIQLINAVHDEIVILVPGETTIDLENSKYSDDGKTILDPTFCPAEEAITLANQVADVMKRVEEEWFEGLMEGRVEIDLAPYWAH